MGKIYLGHPISYYSFPNAPCATEERLISAINKHFPNYSVENPNQPHHAQGYKRKGMLYFLEDVLPNMDAGVFQPFEDDSRTCHAWRYGGLPAWSAGVWKEAVAMGNAGKPVWKITLDETISKFEFENQRVLSVDETRELVAPYRSQ